jgi:hypothetical protein
MLSSDLNGQIQLLIRGDMLPLAEYTKNAQVKFSAVPIPRESALLLDLFLVMRLYWPKTTPPSILPPGEGTWRPPGVKRVA